MGMVCDWDKVDTSVSWKFQAQPGKAEIFVLQASEAVSAGNTYQVEVAGITLPGTVKDTGSWAEYESPFHSAPWNSRKKQAVTSWSFVRSGRGRAA